MRCQEMLTAISKGPEKGEFVGVYLDEKTRLIPFTSIRLDDEEDLLLYFEAQKPPLVMKDFFTQLMLQRNHYLKYWHNGKKRPIYGFKEIDRKLVL